MDLWLADPPFFGGPGQGTRQLIELFVAFGLTALIGLEREVQGKSAGLRTQTIVGTAAALILLVSKYGFSDVLAEGTVVVDPSRVAAQIVSGIGFLGAGIIIFRRGSVHGLTTAAAVWESAAIGMAAGAGLLLLACTVTVMHFVIVLGFMPLARRLAARLSGSVRMHVTYEEGRGVMRELLQACDRRQWQLTDLATDAPGEPLGADGRSGVVLTLSGSGILNAPAVLAAIDGVTAIHQLDEDPD
ncbi:MgtC/SapB family protein [Mycolicibacterium wolinskyi]|uniref:Mg2+ transporter-C (MgtC) family protein n=1 Tax=Mycolicibacterium wolinskyi TaxID=59750 RepID=A0A1X2EVQ8_9MYCO|nr:MULTISPECIES: MgtC/SapB family protein [Mycolicibacterium]MCV7289645.1 MgtC/SapB family protein [Mycolicibacterium wolinskyi]MCV7296616.1 MgtC/SapB family protein [Mycolicibacterium goodii]ORX10226.1 Mg2+ transporter-C (MgtC) family protein [Mycolicibacterium wolinskyi]